MAASSSFFHCSSPMFRYDVFLNFWGADTGNYSFTGHLWAALHRQGFSIFFDDIKLDRGVDVVSELLKAIEQSRVSIVVFSENYGGSSRCLEELGKIMECRRVFNQIVLPIFYSVSPSDVRRQSGSYSKAFNHHEKRLGRHKVEEWRSALVEVSDLPGYHLQDAGNVSFLDEVKFIDVVVDDIKNKLIG